MKKNSKGLLLLVIVLLMGFPVLKHVQADDYDIYVDVDNDGDEKGDEDDPYNTIAEALEKADDGDEIFIEKGEYDENISINKEVEIYGDDIEEVVIKGEIVIKKNAEIKNLTVDGNIVVEDDVDIVLENLIVKDAPDVAINAYAGNGEIVVKNSTIKHSKSKGFYIQKGRDIVITGCNVYKNNEEGLDLRINVDGTISGNNIYENGESGIEFIVGDSDLVIKNNSLKNNGSSGIAAQFYKDNDSKGEISVISNTSAGNSKYGFDCNNPQGGKPGGDYWTNSISVDKNNFKGNDDGEISDECSGLKQPTQEVQEEKQTQTRQEEIEANQKEKEERERQEEENRRATIAENTVELKKLVAGKTEIKNEIEKEVEKIKKRSGFVAFFIGPKYGSISNIQKVASGFSDYLSKFDDLDRKLIDAENQKKAETEIDDILAYVDEVNELIAEKDSKFSLFGWFFRIIS